MKEFRLVMLLIFSSVVAFATTAEGIHFESGTWKEIIVKAKKENKLIFIDCYTSWCGPCKRLSAEIFPLKEVGEVFNKNFINYKVDMEKGEGVTLQKKFHVGAFPTLLWVNAAGEVVHRALGFMQEDTLLKEAQKALNGGSNLSELEDRYIKKPTSLDATRAYLKSLAATADVRATPLAEKYFAMLPEEKYQDQDVFDLMVGYLQNPFSPIGKYFFENRTIFNQKFKKTKVDVMAENIYSRFANSLISQVKNGVEFDEESFQKLIKLMDEQQFEKRTFFVESIRIKMYQNQKNWKGYATKVNEAIEIIRNDNLRSGVFERWYKVILESDCKDPEVLKSALTWANLSFESDYTFNLVRLTKKLQDKLSLLARLKGEDLMIEKTKTELALLNQLIVKQSEFEAKKAETMKMIEAMTKKSHNQIPNHKN
ncbi:thiol:disulfide interchange protein precursor [compost metagenome]